MHRLFYIKFYDKNGKFVAREDYSGMQFANGELVEKFIQAERKSLEGVFDMKLKMNPHQKETPDFSIKQLINAYCEATSLEYNTVISKIRKREIANIRMFITKTALNLGFVHGQLRPFFINGVTYHYETKMDDLIETNDIAAQIWLKTEEKAMDLLADKHKDDGSGEKV